MDQVTCPERNHIAEYVQGTLEEPAMEGIAGHLIDCTHCQAVADELDASDAELLEILREPQPESPYVSEPECRRSLDRLTGLHHKFPWLFQPANHEDADGQSDLPQILGQYVLLKRIGGHLGAVYKAFHLELERLVALKMLPNDLLADDAAAERFKREIKAGGRLDHPNIVRAQDARQVGGKRFLVMEYVDGCDLAELVHARGPLPIAEACEVVRQVAVALQCVSEHGLVHRDIKPANVMLARDGQVKLTDLGLARFRVHQPTGDETSSPGLVMGTADYMAPEQVSDSHCVDIRADIYGLGCTLYKLLAGRAPFESPDCESTFGKLNAHLRESAPPVQQLRPEVPPPLGAVLERMLAKNPAERFETPDQVAAALMPFTAGCNLQTLVAGPNAGEPEEPEKPSRQDDSDPASARSTRWFWELVTLAAAVLLLLFGGRMALQHFGPFWNPSDPPIVASHTPQPTDPRPKETPEAKGQQMPAEPIQPQSDAEPSRPVSPTSAGAETPERTDVVSMPVKPLDTQTATSPNTPPAWTVRAELDHPGGVYRGPPAGPDGEGELIAVKVVSDRPGYLYLLNEQADGTLICLFPNVYQTDNKIEPGRPITVPDPQGDFNLHATPPYGTETLVAFVTAEPLEPGKFGAASLTDQEFTEVDRAAVERLRDELKQKPNTGAESQVKMTTRPGEQQPVEIPEFVPPPPSEATGLEKETKPPILHDGIGGAARNFAFAR